MRANSLYDLGCSYAADFPSQVTSTLERHFHRTLWTCQLNHHAADSFPAKIYRPIARTVALWPFSRRLHLAPPIVYARFHVDVESLSAQLLKAYLRTLENSRQSASSSAYYLAPNSLRACQAGHEAQQTPGSTARFGLCMFHPAFPRNRIFWRPRLGMVLSLHLKLAEPNHSTNPSKQRASRMINARVALSAPLPAPPHGSKLGTLGLIRADISTLLRSHDIRAWRT